MSFYFNEHSLRRASLLPQFHDNHIRLTVSFSFFFVMQRGKKCRTEEEKKLLTSRFFVPWMGVEIACSGEWQRQNKVNDTWTSSALNYWKKQFHTSANRRDSIHRSFFPFPSSNATLREEVNFLLSRWNIFSHSSFEASWCIRVVLTCFPHFELLLLPQTRCHDPYADDSFFTFPILLHHLPPKQACSIWQHKYVWKEIFLSFDTERKSVVGGEEKKMN